MTRTQRVYPGIIYILGLLCGGLLCGCVGKSPAPATSVPAPSPTPRPVSQPASVSVEASIPVSDQVFPVEFGEFKGRMEVWQPLFKGVDYARLWLESPRVLKVHGIRIDLQEPGIEFLATPSNRDHPLDTDSMTTSEFLLKQGCQMAINASPFTPFDRLSSEKGLPKDVQGVSVSRGDVYSGPENDFGAILISKDNRAWVSKPPMELDRAYNGVGGFSMVLEKGKIVASQDTLHPRTAAGVSADGRYVFWMVVDGRQLGFSEGISILETAELIRYLGAYDGVNLDGGGSTAMVISDGKGRARVLNRPIHLAIPCMERPVANHLGVFARPLP